MSDLVLPGTIPGLLRRGSPVVAAKTCHPGIVAGVADDYIAVAWGSPVEGWGEFLKNLPREWLALDLTDATGRAHAAWWLADAGATWGRVADDRTHGPVWLASHGPGGGLLPGVLARRFVAVIPESPIRRSYLCVPSLSDLDPADLRLLPDGCRRVDAEALRRVVLHVAGVAS